MLCASGIQIVLPTPPLLSSSSTEFSHRDLVAYPQDTHAHQHHLLVSDRNHTEKSRQLLMMSKKMTELCVAHCCLQLDYC